MLTTVTIRRADIFDHLCAAVDEARTKSANDPAWLARINDAWDWLLAQDAYEIVNFGTPHAAVRIPSATRPGLIYTANGTCQCRAYETHTPCWHRAASRLLRNALAKSFDAFAQRFTIQDASYNRQTCEAHNDTRGADYWRRIGDRLVALAAPPTFACARSGKTAQEEIDELFPS